MNRVSVYLFVILFQVTFASCLESFSREFTKGLKETQRQVDEHYQKYGRAEVTSNDSTIQFRWPSLIVRYVFRSRPDSVVQFEFQIKNMSSNEIGDVEVDKYLDVFICGDTLKSTSSYGVSGRHLTFAPSDSISFGFIFSHWPKCTSDTTNFEIWGVRILKPSVLTKPFKFHEFSTDTL